MSAAIRARLDFLYGSEQGGRCYQALTRRLEHYRTKAATPTGAEDPILTERDSMLITYGDMVREPDTAPLATLADFLGATLKDSVSAVHVLPFFPYSSDDGFSVIDYRQVDPALGTWSDIQRLGRDFKLMMDVVINHVSAHSEWFQGYLRGDSRYEDWFVEIDPAVDLSSVVRPRALPLLTAVHTPRGERHVWTTFSTDQIDLNYHDPDVLMEMIDILLFYVDHGADFIRLDAIAYLWKEPGSPCIHLPQTHQVVQLLRATLDQAAPRVRIITETNVPHPENVSYFGDGSNEANLVYNFALPPLVLHTFRTGKARAFSDWAAELGFPSDRVSFFNFLASHDGIGLNAARGILPEADIALLAQQAVTHGGFVSYKNNPDGSQSPYELNINYFDALSDPQGPEPLDLQIGRFMAAQSILLAFKGMPGIYFHSLFGSRGWPEGVQITGRPRTINRQKLDRAALEHDLADPDSLRSRVFRRFVRLLQARAASKAFHPAGEQKVLDCGESILALQRISPDNSEHVLCLHNVMAVPQEVRLPDAFRRAEDMLAGETLEGAPRLKLSPYQVRWLRLGRHD